MSILDGIKGDGKLQTEKEIAVKRNLLEERMDEIMRRHEGWLMRDAIKGRYVDIYNHVHDIIDDLTVDPAMIDGFCLRMKGQQHMDLFEYNGLFLSAMLQKAYDAGHNDLIIPTRHLDESMACIGVLIKGKEDDLLRVTIDGKAGHGSGWRSEYSDFTFMGDADERCGRGAKHSHLTFEGWAGDVCGSDAEHLRIIFKGDVGHFSGLRTKDSRFCSSKIGILKEIKRISYTSCCFYLIEPDGSHTEVLR